MPYKRKYRKRTRRPVRRKQPNRKVKTNKQLTRAVKSLKKMHEIKYQYVDYDNKILSVLSTPATTSFRVTSIPSGSGPSSHEGDSVSLRTLDIHAQCYVGNSSGAPTINGPRTLTLMAVRSSDPTTGTTPLNFPTASSIYRFAAESPGTAISEENLPLTDNFRLLNRSNTTHLKVLAKKSFILEPHGPVGTVTPLPAGQYPIFPTRADRVKFSMSVPVKVLKVNFETGTSTNNGQSVWIIAYCNSRGTGADLGIRLSYTSKLSFWDRD